MKDAAFWIPLGVQLVAHGLLPIDVERHALLGFLVAHRDVVPFLIRHVLRCRETPNPADIKMNSATSYKQRLCFRLPWACRAAP